VGIEEGGKRNEEFGWRLEGLLEMRVREGMEVVKLHSYVRIEYRKCMMSG
jgi:hypothetical protein